MSTFSLKSAIPAHSEAIIKLLLVKHKPIKRSYLIIKYYLADRRTSMFLNYFQDIAY